MLKELSFDDLTNFIRRRRDLMLGIMILVLVLLGSLLVAVPQIKTFFTRREAFLKEEKTLSQLKEKLFQLEKIKYDPDYTQFSQIVNLALQDNKPLLELLASLDQVSRAASVELAGLELSPGDLATDSAKSNKTKTEAADSLSVTFKITGSFQQVSQFMELLEKVAPFTTIDNFSISEGKARVSSTNASGSASETLDLVSVSLSCSTYFANVSVKTVFNSPIPTLSSSDLTVLEKLKEFQATQLPEQKNIEGGLEDLFGLPEIKDLYSKTSL